MAGIFGISNLPVTIFTTPLEPIEVPKLQEKESPSMRQFSQSVDRFVGSTKVEKGLSKFRKIFNRLTLK